MTTSIRTNSVVSPTLTQQTVYDGLKQALANAGFTTLYDEYTSGTDKFVVYQIIIDNTKIYGSAYIRFGVTNNLTLTQQLYATWIRTTHSGSNGSAGIIYPALVNNTSFNFVALNMGVECKLVMAYQESNYHALGYISPANKPDWWSLDSFPYVFIPTSNTFAICRSTTLNPFNNSEYDLSVNWTRMGVANWMTNRRDLLNGIVFFTQSNQGVIGRTSDDLVSVAGAGTTRFDTIQVPSSSEQYLIINPASGGLAIRIA